MLLDLDGTLADSLAVMRLAYQAFLGAFGATATAAEFDSLNGPPLAEVVRRLALTHGLPGGDAALLARYEAVIDDIYRGVAPHAGAGELLRKARENNCTVGIVTSNSARRTQAWLAAAGLSPQVAFIVSGDQVQRGKPDPEPYVLAVQRAACDQAAVVAVEDSPQGARSAVAAGLRTFVVEHGGEHHAWPGGVAPVASLAMLAQLLWPSSAP